MQASDDAQPETNPLRESAFTRNAEWLRGLGESNDVVMSSRVRLARNISGFPFTPQASRIDRTQVLEACRHRILNMTTSTASQFMWINLHQVGREDRNLLVERQLMSRQHAKGKLSTGKGGLDEPRGVAVLVPDERVSIMINEEDHLRLQIIRSGLALTSCLAEANELDDQIEAGMDYAYHPRFGYLTACPTNVGTGLRLSVMLHLPGLKLTGELEKVRRAAHDMGLAVRGFYGEGSDSPGEFYQLSNQTTLGKSDEMLLREMEQEIVPRVVGYERHARKNLIANRKEMLEDQIWRAIGVLKNARLMKVEEAMEYLSLVRVGAMLGLVEGVTLEQIHTLLLHVQPMHLQKTLGKTLTQQQRRVARAELIRKQLTPDLS
ncbi:MAG: protein arginine kinase [Phycisphaerales bacterium]|nr:protein arginine kinase [Phycisphaerales bacterium]